MKSSAHNDGLTWYVVYYSKDVNGYERPGTMGVHATSANDAENKVVQAGVCSHADVTGVHTS